MKKVLLVLFVLVAAACSTPGDTAGPDTTGPTTTVASSPSTSDGSSATSSTAPGETTTTSGRQVAPDFTLELGDGGTYTLSEGEKPVYLVFWAEW